MSLHNLRQKKEEVQKEFSRLDAQVHADKLTSDERDVYLRNKFGSPDESRVLQVIEQQISEYSQEDEFHHKTIYLITGFSFVVVVLFATLLYSTGGITGAVVAEIHSMDVLFEKDGFILVWLNETNSVGISGDIEGTGAVKIYLRQSSENYLLYESAGSDERRERFDGCGEACNLVLSGESHVVIDIEGDLSVFIKDITLSSRENTPPVQKINIPDFTTKREVVMDLNDLFEDIDGDELSFKIKGHATTEEEISGGVLRISGVEGTYGYVVVVDDGTSMVESNVFAVTFRG